MIAGNNQKKLFQIGQGNEAFYLFNRENLTVSINGGMKTAIASNDLGDGDIDLKGRNGFLKGGYFMDVDFVLDNTIRYDNLNYLQDIFYSGEKIVYFWEKQQDGSVKIYYNYAKMAVPPRPLDETQSEDLGAGKKSYNAQFHLRFPFFFEASDTDLRIIDIDSAINAQYVWGDGTLWGSASEWGNSLTEYKTLTSYFVNKQAEANFFINCDRDFNLPFYLQDRLFLRNTKGLETTNSQSITVTSSAEVIRNTTLDLKSSYKNVAYLIQFSPLTTGQTLRIENNSNNSSMLFTWVGTVTSSEDIIYNSLYNKCYGATTGVDISDIQFYSTDSNKLLYFSNYLMVNPLNTQTTDTLKLSTTASTINVIIKNIKLNH